MMIAIKIVLIILAVLVGLNTLLRGSLYFGFWKTDDSLGTCFPEIGFDFPCINFIVSLLLTILLIVLIIVL